MAWFRCWLSLLGIVMLLAAANGRADTPRTADSKASSPAREEPGRLVGPATGSPTVSSDKPPANASPLSLEMLKLPAGAIIVLCEQAGDALRLIPQMVILKPQEYQELLKQLEQLKLQLAADKPDNPSSCKLTGCVEGDTAYLQAHFAFKTERPSAFVNLGCARAMPTAASLDGGLACLQPSEEGGYVLRVDTPGIHQAVVDLQVRLTSPRGSKGADRSLDLDLPRAAIVILERLDLPAAVPEVRIGPRSVRTTPVDAQHSRLEQVPIVSIRPMSVAWKGPAAKPSKGPPLREVDGRIIVRVTETYVFTEAELNLQVRSGETAEWRLRLPALPPDAVLEVKSSPQDEQRIQPIVLPADKQDPILIIHLNEASAEPLLVTLHIRQPRPAGALGIGPFAVLDALTQKGKIEIRAPDELRLRYPQPAGEVSQQEVSEDQRSQSVRAVFSYWNMPGSTQSSQPVPPLLTLHVEAVKGWVETHVTQGLHLEKDTAGTLRWQLTTQIKVTPIRTAVDRLDVSLPAEYEYDKGVGATPAEIVEDVVPDPLKQTTQVKLAHKQIRPFVVTLVGWFRTPASTEEASLDLVRPLTWSVERGSSGEPSSFNVLDRGCQVDVVLPEGVEFAEHSNGRAALGAPRSALLLLPKAGSREYTWQGERTPPRIDLAWRARLPELPVDALVDVILAGNQGRARQQLRYQFGPLPHSSLLLRVPPQIQQSVRILEGGARDGEESRMPGEWAIRVPATAGRDHTLTLEYSFPIREAAAAGQDRSPRIRSARPLTVPLIRPVQATRGETRVRIWCDPGEEPKPAGRAWTELPTEIVPELDTLPVLVLRGGHESTLVLRLTEPVVAPLAAAVVERILVQAMVHDRGVQAYRVRFMLSKLTSRHLDLELPVLLSSSDLDVRVDGKRVPLHFVDDSGKETDIGKIVRLRVEPELYHRPVLLDVSYQADSGRMEGNGLLQSTLYPPVLRSAILLGRARWRVDLPGGWMPIALQHGSSVEQHWGWWGWLPAPRPALSRAELEQWLDGTETPVPVEESEPSLVCWQSALGPLTLVQAPQRIWLLVCSLTILVLGLGLLLAPLSRYLFWTCIVVIPITVAAIGVFSPAALSAVGYGCEPGALVLAVAVAAQWTVHRRYRRQVILMPGFARLKPGSSLIRSNNNRTRDPSTIDEPPKRPSSIVPGAQPGNSGQ
jgi:hypothetical protein